MVSTIGQTAIQAKVRLRLPAALHGEMVDRAGADPVGLEAGPGLHRGGGHILGCLRGPVGKEICPGLAKRALQRHANPHPAVVVEFSIGQPSERCLDRGQASDLAVDALDITRRCNGREATLAQRFREQRIGLIEESDGSLSRDFRKVGDVDVRQPLLGPGIGRAGVGVDGIGHELLPEAEHLQRMAFDAAERLVGAIDQHPLRGPANAQGGCVTEALA